MERTDGNIKKADGVLQEKAFIKGKYSYKVNGRLVEGVNVGGTVYSYGMRFMLYVDDDGYSSVWIEVRDEWLEGRHDVVAPGNPYLLYQSNGDRQEWIATEGFLDFKRGQIGANTTCKGTFAFAHNNINNAKITEGFFDVAYQLDDK